MDIIGTILGCIFLLPVIWIVCSLGVMITEILMYLIIGLPLMVILKLMGKDDMFEEKDEGYV